MQLTIWRHGFTSTGCLAQGCTNLNEGMQGNCTQVVPPDSQPRRRCTEAAAQPHIQLLKLLLQRSLPTPVLLLLLLLLLLAGCIVPLPGCRQLSCHCSWVRE